MLLARRNDSLGTGGRFLVFAFLFTVSAGIATGFAAIGAWPVLPFAGAELVGLYLAFRHVERQAGDFERIVIAGNRLEIQCRDGGRMKRYAFNRWWTSLMEDGAAGSISLRCHGREVRVGRHLIGAERAAAAERLRQALRSGA